MGETFPSLFLRNETAGLLLAGNSVAIDSPLYKSSASHGIGGGASARRLERSFPSKRNFSAHLPQESYEIRSERGELLQNT